MAAGDGMNKPQGYLHSANDGLFCLLILGLPYYESIFYASLSRVILFCILAILLLFLAKYSEDIAQAIHRCIFARCSGVVLPSNCPSWICFVLPVHVIQDPFLTPFSKRPPPSLLVSPL